MRLFIALNLSEELRLNLYNAAAPLRAAFPGARWVAPELQHITVKFLGERDDVFAGAASALLDAIAARYGAMHVEVAGVGGFPNLRRPSVVWMGVAGSAKLELLHHDTEIEFERLGCTIEGRAFRPHITLARVRDPHALVPHDFARECGRVEFKAGAIIRSIDLMSSRQSPSGLSYAAVHRATFARGDG